MYEHEAESDEDCEVYFLKPVNEYNIVDKIKEANKELFDDGAGNLAGNGAGGSRKVTFAPNLEDYEPTATEGGSNVELESTAATAERELIEELAKLKLRSERCAPIAEEELPAGVSEAVIEPVEEVTETADLEEEEICEEILDIVDVEASPETISSSAHGVVPVELEEEEDDDDFSGVYEDDLEEPAAAALPVDKGNSQLQRRIGQRQDTFDHDGESDNKSLTNLLTESDCEEEERTLQEARLKLRQAYQSLYKTLDASEQAKIDELTGAPPAKTTTTTTATTTSTIATMRTTTTRTTYEEAAEEDDDLSIIVAAYIPDDFELNEQSIYYKRDAETELEQPLSNNNHSNNNSERKTFFGARRFSLRRRSKPTEEQQLAVPEIKLNYKTCCEHRHSMQDGLPRYMGYMSEYGLSAQQLQRREQRQRRKQRFVLEQTLNRNEQELRKMKDNERAFTTWLKNKMRYPINKTRNMFDGRLRRGSVAAATPTSPQQPPRSGRSRHRADEEVEVHPYRHLLGHWNK